MGLATSERPQWGSVAGGGGRGGRREAEWRVRRAAGVSPEGKMGSWSRDEWEKEDQAQAPAPSTCLGPEVDAC